MTKEHEASRTLVKSPPELWAECSDAGSLARHLGEFGEIKITRLEPETTVAWEGEHASGTVRIEPSGWGTRVTLTAQTMGDEVDAPPDGNPPEAEAIEEPSEAQGPSAAQEPRDVEEPSEGQNPSEGQEIIGEEVHLPGEDPPTATEEDDATVEETLEDADPVLASNSGAFRIRWRRVKGRVRGFFGSKPPLEPTEATLAEESRGSLAPPTATGDPVGVEAPAVENPPQPEAELAESERSELPDREPELAEPEVAEPELDAEAVLTAALDSLGQAHHRPFSRA